MFQIVASDLPSLLSEIRSCQICQGLIPEPRPVIRANSGASVLIVGQAPGTKVHASGVPWDDASGKRLRSWMGVDESLFYNDSKIAIVPMGLCYPGKGKSGDLPPRPECAPAWHEKVRAYLPNIKCTMLIGQYAQNYYLESDHKTLTTRVKDWQQFAPECFALPHPSPRNQIWLKKNTWFENETVPELQKVIRSIL
jgi:uracil-DNA glycosylase